MFFESYTEKVWGRHPSEISAEWGAQRIKGLSIRKLFQDVATKSFAKLKKESQIDISQKKVETSLIEKFLYPKYGPGQIWEFVANGLEQNENVTIYMNSKITKIKVYAESDKDDVQYRNTDGTVSILSCAYVISTMTNSQ